MCFYYCTIFEFRNVVKVFRGGGEGRGGKGRGEGLQMYFLGALFHAS